MAPDVAAAGRFYAAVLGWTVPEPEEQWGGYVVANVDGAAAAGIGPLQPDAPPAWTLYFATDDADAHTATTKASRRQRPERRRWTSRTSAGWRSSATRRGAVFGLWQAGTMIGAELVNEPGGLVWEDLRSTDPAKAQDFYRELFGFRLDAMEMAGPDYSTFALPGEGTPLGGMGGMMGYPCRHPLALARLLRGHRHRHGRGCRAGLRRQRPRAAVRHGVRADGGPRRPGRSGVHGDGDDGGRHAGPVGVADRDPR